MNLFKRATKYIDMDRVKELREEKIKRETIAEILRQQEEIRAELEYIKAEESKYVNWKRELEEGMTTSDMGMANYPAVGDVNLGAAMSDIFLSGPSGNGYNSVEPSLTGSRTQFDTLVVTISSTSSDWEILPNTSFNVLGSGGVGDYTVVIPRTYSGLFFTAKDDGSFSASVQYQRRKPVNNVVVSLDEPNASAFVRDGDFDRLSNEQKKKKLEEQLSSSEEYLNKMFGEGMPKGATTIADTEPQQSFADTKVSLSPEDLKAISDRVGGSYVGSQGTEIAQAGPKGFDRKPGTYHKNLIIPIKSPGSKWRPGEGVQLQDPLKNIPFTGPGLSKGIDGTKVAASYPTTNKPLDKVGGFKGIPKGKGIYPMDKDGNLYNPQTGLPIKKAGKKQTTMVAHHEPQGKVLSEKKRLKSPKDLIDKIPGYYDGKPSPLGFPVEEPPKMKNGYHPDLVDGKKVANRFNRLDPISARAMPKTGNPHIDKEVAKAKNKPK